MRTHLNIAGETTTILSGGETRRAIDWILYYFKKMVDENIPEEDRDFEVKVPGRWDGPYPKLTQIGPIEGRILDPDSLPLDYADIVAEDLPVFQRMQDEYNRPDLKYLYAKPGVLDMALFSGSFRPEHYEAWLEADRKQWEMVSALARAAGVRLVSQIDSPTHLLLSMTPEENLPEPWRRYKRHLGDFVLQQFQNAPADVTEIALHDKCRGDKDGKANVEDMNFRAFVEADERTFRVLPSGLRVVYSEYPFAAGRCPAPTEREPYEIMSELDDILPKDTHIVAGIAHEGQPVEDQIRIAEQLEDITQRKVWISGACGNGRLDQEATETRLGNSNATVLALRDRQNL